MWKLILAIGLLTLAAGAVYAQSDFCNQCNCCPAGCNYNGCSGGACLMMFAEGPNCPGNECNNWWDCAQPCSPSCGSPLCGQGDGCGGSCSSQDNVWSGWGACTAPSFTRTRSNACVGTQTEDCRGSIAGSFFDASTVGNCGSWAAQPKIEGAGVEVTAVVNHSATYSTTTDNSGAYTLGGLPVPETYDLSYTVDEDEWVVDPPKLLCDGGLIGISLSSQGQSVTRKVGLWRIYGGWFQAVGGDVYGQTGIDVTIPATCILAANRESCNSFEFGGSWYTPLIAADTTAPGTATAGVAFAKSGGVELGGADNAVVSQTEYQAESGYGGRNYDYGYFFAQTGRLERSSWDGAGKPTGSAEGQIYTSSGNVEIDWSLGADEKIVIIHDGDVAVSGNVDVPLGSYLSVVAKGSITFGANVTRAEGVFVADSVVVASTGDKMSEQQFVGEGTFVGWNGVSLRRDRGITNNGAPAEQFVFRPDLVINAPSGMRNPKVQWQEVAP